MKTSTASNASLAEPRPREYPPRSGFTGLGWIPVNGAVNRPTVAPAVDDMSGLLDAISHALLIVDRYRTIHYANPAAWAALADGAFLRCQDGVLTAGPNVRSALGVVIATSLHEADPGTAAGANGRKDVLRHVVLRSSEGLSRIAYVRALEPRVTGAGGGGGSRALVTMPSAHAVSIGCADGFALLYGLTPMEQRVLVHVANGATLKATASALGIGSATVTTHLKHIFDKTGVRRQSEVVGLLLRSLPPLLR